MLKNKFYEALDKLQQAIFACYLNHDYPANRYGFEKTIHDAGRQVFLLMKKIRQQINDPLLISKFEKCYEVIFSLNNLKYRVKDYSTFEVCEKEFTRLTDCLSRVLTKRANIDELSLDIERLDELYRNTLQIVTNDPIVFLFFIQNIMALRDELETGL